MKCPTCSVGTESIKSSIVSGRVVTGCPACLPKQLQKSAPTAAKYYRREQQTKFRRELTQRVDPKNFSRAYPEKAREIYGDEKFRGYTN